MTLHTGVFAAYVVAFFYYRLNPFVPLEHLIIMMASSCITAALAWLNRNPLPIVVLTLLAAFISDVRSATSAGVHVDSVYRGHGF